MSNGDFVHVEPAELKFQFELRKQGSCSMILKNKTDQPVAFKVKTTNPRKYCVRPNTGVILPDGACDVIVTMQAPKEAPPDMQCKDKFLVQSVKVPEGSTMNDITSEMFNKEDGKVVEEFKLKVVYVPAKPPSPVPEESEEGSPSHDDVSEQASQTSTVSMSRYFEGSKEIDAEVRAQVAKLTNEKASAIQQNQKLKQELEMLKREMNRRRSSGVQLYIVILIGVLGILLGYLMKKT